MAKSEDLWPDFGDTTMRTPITILREQALYLTKKTRGVIEAEVRTDTQGRYFIHNFDLVVPALHDYRYEVFFCRHEISLYPISVSHSYAEDKHEPPETFCDDEPQFLLTLGTIFKSPEVIRTVKALISQAMDPPDHLKPSTKPKPVVSDDDIPF